VCYKETRKGERGKREESKQESTQDSRLMYASLITLQPTRLA
jgi:hypothetical protein